MTKSVEELKSEYVGQVKERITVQVTITGIYGYEARSFTGFGTDHHTIYIMEDSNGNVFKVDTTSEIYLDERTKSEKSEGSYNHIYTVSKGDVITIKGTVKDHKEYKEVKQTVLNRVVVLSRSFKAETWEEKQERTQKEKALKRQEQMNTICCGDIVQEMTYRQYKEHYSDCETVIDSFKSHERQASTIQVIIRNGRMKNSGVRGKHFHGYDLMDKASGQHSTFRAVSLENAVKQCLKEFCDWDVELYKIYK